MSNKAKRAKAVKARKHQQSKVNNRIRGIVKNYGLTEAEAHFYRRALVTKETPAEFVTTVVKDLNDLLSSFDLLTDVAKEEAVMAALLITHPVIAESIKNAGVYLKDTKVQLQELHDKYLEEFKDLDASNNSYLFASSAMEDFSNLQEELSMNVPNMMLTLEQILDVYADLERNYPGE